MFVNSETGRPWYDVKKPFARAREKAALPGLWFHDLRRSFVTNAVRRGNQETVVMKLSGHKDPGVFERYNIVQDGDIRRAMVVFEEGQEAERKKPSEKESGKKEERSVAVVA